MVINIIYNFYFTIFYLYIKKITVQIMNENINEKQYNLYNEDISEDLLNDIEELIGDDEI